MNLKRSTGRPGEKGKPLKGLMAHATGTQREEVMLEYGDDLSRPCP